MFALCRPKHQGSTPRGTPGDFGPKWLWPTPCWFERRRHLIANCVRMITDSATAQWSQWRAYRKPPSLFEWFHRWPPTTSPSHQNGGSICPKIREWPYIRNRWSDTLHVWFYMVGFSGSTDRMALFPVTSNPSWRQAAILDNFEWPYLRNGSFDPLI